MEIETARQLARANLDVLIIIVCAWAVGAWFIFDHFNAPNVDEFDKLGPIDVRVRKRELKEATRAIEIDQASDVVTPAERMATHPQRLDAERAIDDYRRWRIRRVVGL